MIYFIQDIANQTVKIGYTRMNPYRRLKDAQLGNPNSLILMGTVVGHQELERRIHEKFEHLHTDTNGEWFRLDKELAEFISSAIEIGSAGLAMESNISADRSIPPEPERIEIQVEIRTTCSKCKREERKNTDFYIPPDIDIQTFIDWAKAVTDGRSLGVNQWCGRDAPFTIYKYTALMSELESAGLVKNHGGNLGRKLTLEGQQVLREFVAAG